MSLGALHSPALIGALQWLERFVYAKAATVTVIASRMRDRLLAKGVPPGKVRVVANCTDVETLRPLQKDNAFAREHGIAERFVVSYAGNMGPAQGLETLLDAAALLRAEPEVRILLLGDGILRDALAERIARDGLGNVLMLPQQPYAGCPRSTAPRTSRWWRRPRRAAATPCRRRCIACFRQLIFATYRRTRKYRNLAHNGKVAVLIDGQEVNSSGLKEGFVLTALGQAEEISVEENEVARRVHLAWHPDLESFVRSADCALVRVTVREYQVVGPIDDVKWWRIDDLAGA